MSEEIRRIRIRVICQLGRHTVLAVNDPEIEPGHQRIGVTPDDVEGVSLLFGLTGNTGVVYGWVQQTRFEDGQSATFVPHDEVADERLIKLVDLCASLRYSAPQLVQLGIEGWDHEPPA